MIPATHPTFTNPFNGFGDCKISYLSSVSGLAAWTDYIPVRTVVASTSIEGRTEANGYQNVHPVGATGNVAWTDYIPVYEAATKTVPWSTDANGYIPVGMSTSGVLGFLSEADVQLELTHTAIPTRGSLTPTFTRATTETGQKWDDNGYLDFTALAGEIVFKGARRERNYFASTEDFSTIWVASTASISANATTSPTGTLTADKLIPSAGSGTQNVVQAVSNPAGTMLFSCFFRTAGYSYVQLLNSATSDFANFDISTGVVGTTGGVATSVISSEGNGWYRCSAVLPQTGAATFRIQVVSTASAARAAAFTGDGTQGVYLWGAQLNDITGETDQTTIRPYVSVGVASAPAYHGSMVDGVKCYDTDRSGNPISTSGSYPIVGYVPWEARTNLCLQSNAFGASGAPTAPWTENGGVLGCAQNVVGPDGATSAWTFTDDNVAGIEGRAQAITLTAAAWTTSIFVKKTTGATTYPVLSAFTGSVFAGATIDTNNGVCTPWVSFDALTAASGMSATCRSHDANYWRASLTFTGTAAAWTFIDSPAVASTPTQSAFVGATAAAVTGSAVFYGAQVELGAFATPYQPTTTIAVARNASVLTYTGADAANIKTLMIGVTPRVAGLSDSFTVVSLSGAAANKQIYFDKQGAVTNGTLYVRDTTDQVFVNIGTYTAGVKTKVAGRFSTNNFAGCINGGTVGTDTSGTKPAVTQLNVGTDIAASVFINSPVGPIYGWTSRELSDSELRAITS